MMEATELNSQDSNRRLPDGWRWVRLGEVAKVFAGSAAPQGDDYFDPQGPPFVRVSDLGQKRRTSFLVDVRDRLSPKALRDCSLVLAKKGTVLFPKSGAAISTNNRAVLGIDAYIVSHLMAVEATEQTTSDWLYWLLCQLDMMDYSDNTAYPSLKQSTVGKIEIPLPPLSEQKRIAAILNEQMAAVERARTAAEAEMELSASLIESYLRQSLSNRSVRRLPLCECLQEVSSGVGVSWNRYPVMGATRDGIAPAKEAVGKDPERYKLVEPGTIFYNPMRILIGSIAMIDEGKEPGITSPDYVVFKTAKDTLHPRWFYYWLRSSYGQACIKSLARGAVRERMLFRRLVSAEIDVPSWESQVDIAEKLKSVAELRRSVGGQLDTINKLPAALLRRAFSGEL